MSAVGLQSVAVLAGVSVRTRGHAVVTTRLRCSDRRKMSDTRASLTGCGCSAPLQGHAVGERQNISTFVVLHGRGFISAGESTVCLFQAQSDRLQFIFDLHVHRLVSLAT